MELESIQRQLIQALINARMAGREDVHHNITQVVKDLMDNIQLYADNQVEICVKLANKMQSNDG